MSVEAGILKRKEIVQLAAQAKLMIKDGAGCYINDMASEKELVVFTRMLEARLRKELSDELAISG